MGRHDLPWDSRKPMEVIHIGEFVASREPMVITTFLGSCVAVCLFDQEKKIGGMNHILVPGKASFRDFNVEARFGINAMELLINALMKLGADRARLKAKVFGGAQVIPSDSGRETIGRKNADFVLEFLERENIPLVCKDLEGLESRRIFFHTDTAQVFLKRGQTLASRRLVQMERKKLRVLQEKIDKPGEITWFDHGHEKE